MFDNEFNDMFAIEYDSFLIDDKPQYDVFKLDDFCSAVECLITFAFEFDSPPSSFELRDFFLILLSIYLSGLMNLYL